MLRKKYINWKNNIQKAELIEAELERRYGYRPSKRDFVNSGQYNAYMALYRYRKKLRPQKNMQEKISLVTIRKAIFEDPEIEKNIQLILSDIIYALGEDKFDEILEKIWRERFNTKRTFKLNRKQQKYHAETIDGDNDYDD